MSFRTNQVLLEFARTKVSEKLRGLSPSIWVSTVERQDGKPANDGDEEHHDRVRRDLLDGEVVDLVFGLLERKVRDQLEDGLLALDGVLVERQSGALLLGVICEGAERRTSQGTVCWCQSCCRTSSQIGGQGLPFGLGRLKVSSSQG